MDKQISDLNDLQGEIWKDIDNYEGIYKISSCCRIKSLARLIKSYRGLPHWRKERIIKPFFDTRYLRIELRKNEKGKKFLFHVLLAKAFIPNPLNLPEINHIDGNKLNNLISNLEWVTHPRNIEHAFEIGLKTHDGEKNPTSKLTEAQVLEIRRSYSSIPNVWSNADELAEKFGVCKGTIQSIAYGVNWQHI